jgi:NtrC-family two-component system response regulator AlgB
VSAKRLDLDVLVVDDEKRIRSTLRTCLEVLGCRVAEAANGPAVRARLERRGFDLVLLDLRLGDENGLDLLPALLAKRPAPAVVIITAHATIETAVQATRSGAHSILRKPFTPTAVQHHVEAVALERRIDVEVERRRDTLKHQRPPTTLATESPRMRLVLELVDRLASQPVPVLLRGEAGTGKEALARRLHALSPRCASPFLVLRPAGTSPEQLARELFGQAADAFLDDSEERLGLVEAATRGALFIDEIAELPSRLQRSLARLIAEQRYERAGDTASLRADVRVVAASSYDLERELRAGRLERVLYELLSPAAITVPPLRERREDIMPLARAFLSFFARAATVTALDFSLDTETALLGYGWPGNVRELCDVMERAAILRNGTRVELEALPEQVTAARLRIPSLGGEFTLDAIEREHILRVLATTPTQEEAARVLGVDVSTLWRKRRRYGL